MQFLANALNDDAFLLDMEAESLNDVFELSLDHLISRDLIVKEHRNVIHEALLTREKAVSTAIGQAVAIPHAYVPEIEKPTIFFIRLKRPLNLGAPDGVPTRFFFILLGPTGFAAEHLDTLTSIARLMSDEEFRYDLQQSRSRKNVLDSLERFHLRNTPIIPEAVKKAEEELKFSGKPFGGVWNDFKRRWPHYRDDWTRGWSSKSAAAIVFLFFACLAPAVTFGGIMGAITDQQIGVVEMLIATASGGMIYAIDRKSVV